ncbi:ATP-dependent helicase [Bradyrhizobium jicamae]|uniref:ATP-dependent helicase n=1 Tax=Bradyrhizobium jicamae TaxID=280332 RepID=UPI001BAD7A2E|nr:ATP-dependent helicase [Bradyrhizobium jicamae]MBR0939245.1 ATP-dependent helicase [Bradyrhizobium jicamae]
MSNKTMNSSALERLNPRQRKAVTFGMKTGEATQHRPLLIIAGAGTGKTETMAKRIAWLIACGAKPSEIFAASFTKRASKELDERAQKAANAAVGNVLVRLPYAGTFHSIAVSLLNEFHDCVGLGENFTVLGRDDAADLMDLVQARSGEVGKNSAFPDPHLCSEIYSYQRGACLSLKATLKRNRYRHCEEYAKPLAKLFASFTEAKRSQNSVDFDDLLVLLGELLQHPTVGRRLRRRFKYVLIDEFQDTNRLQFKIVKLLKPTGRGLTVVGDDAQAIYSFRAATVKNIRRFSESFPCSAKVITLTRNYRSTEPILQASNAVMSLAVNAFKKELWSKRKSDQLPLLTTVADEQVQADHGVRTALELREQGVPFGQQAVLFRTSQQSLGLEVALRRAKIPFQKWGGSEFLESAHIRNVMAVLKWWQNPRDQIAAFRVLMLLDGVGKATADRLAQELCKPKFQKVLSRAVVPNAAAKQWKALVRLFGRLFKPAWPAALEEVVRWYRPYLARLDSAERRKADLDQLVALGGAFGSCREFLTNLALDPPGLLAEQKLSEENADDLLTLSTIHSAKGCEWKCITILSAMDGCIPSSKCRSEDDIEEERRLLYVAMTRAKDRLEIILPRRNFQAFRRNVPAATVYSKPSRFLPQEIHGRFERRTASTQHAVSKASKSTAMR